MRIKSFDCLRGYGCLVILFAHLPQLGESLFAHLFKRSFSQFAIGYILLDMFFALSGFLITSIILNEKKKGTFSFKQFYFNRTLRIFPIYYIAIILVAIFISTDYLIYPALYISNYFFSFHNEVHPLNNTWSLAVEEHFYLLWPILIMSFNTKALKWITGLIIPLIAILTVVVVGFTFEPHIASNLVSFGTTTRCLGISLGAFLAFHVEWLTHFSRRAFIKTVLLGFGFYLFYYFMPLIPGLKLIPQYARLVCIVPLLSVTTVVIWYRLNFVREGILKYLLLNPIVEYVGKISYGLYLFHYPIYYYFNFTDWQTPKTDDVFTYWLVLVLSLCAAMLSFRFIETPLLNLRHKVNFNKVPKTV